MKLEFAKNIKNLRINRGITQNDLAEELGVSEQTVSRWESSSKASYPDIELLPTIAGFFGVTVDELLGCSKAQSDERLAKYWEEVEACGQDSNKCMAILRQMYKEYPNDIKIMCNICETGTFYIKDKYNPDNVSLVRECATRILEESTNKDYRERATEILVIMEDEDKIDDILEKYTTNEDLSRYELLKFRYHSSHKNDKKKYSEILERNTLQAIYKYLYTLMAADAIEESKLDEYHEWFYNFVFNFINSITEVHDDLIMGDGAVDLWTYDRIQFGFMYAMYLCEKKETEKALDVLDKSVLLAEKICEIPDGTVLTSRCPGLSHMNSELRRQVYRCSLSYSTTTIISGIDGRHDYDHHHGIYFTPAFEYLDNKQYYENNHPEIVKDERFNSIFNRLRKLAVDLDGEDFEKEFMINYEKTIDKHTHHIV